MDSLTAVPLNQPHWECVSPQLRYILETVSRQPFADRFYLAGGTALALQLGHRVSVDLDFFSEQDELLDSSRTEIINTLRKALDFEIVQNAVGSMLLNVEGIALGFFSYQFPCLSPAVSIEQITLAGLTDLGLMKLDAIASRGVRKDFTDLYFIAQQLPLEALIEQGREKYPTVRDFETMVLTALTDFSVADQQTAIETVPAISWPEIRTFCLQQARQLAHQWFEDET